MHCRSVDVFDREVTEPQWWFQEADEDARRLEPATFIEYGTRLFRKSGEVLARYSDGQVNDGLYYIIHRAAGMKSSR